MSMLNHSVWSTFVYYCVYSLKEEVDKMEIVKKKEKVTTTTTTTTITTTKTSNTAA